MKKKKLEARVNLYTYERYKALATIMGVSLSYMIRYALKKVYGEKG